MSDGFVNLHLHTDKSLLDGMIKVDQLMQKTLEYNQKAVAITDHGNMYQVVDATLEAKKSGQKYIIGTELYVVHDHTIKGKSEGETEYKNNRKHFLMLAKNKAGYQKMCRIVSKGYTDGFYYRPRVDNGIFKEFLDDKEDDLIASSACFVKGTKVYTSDGVKNIEDIKQGDVVLTHKGNYQSVIPTQRNYKGNLCTIQSTMPIIKCTEDHQFFTITQNDLNSDAINGKWKKAKDLTDCDFLLTPIDETIDDVDSIKIQLYEYVNGIYKDISIHTKITDDLIYFIGICFGCGKFNRTEKLYGLNLYLEYGKIVDFVKKFVKDYFGITPDIYKDEDYVHVVVNNAKADSLISSFKEKFPQFIRYLSPQKQLFFLRGLACGDSITFNLLSGTVFFTTHDIELFYEVQRIFTRNYIDFIATVHEDSLTNLLPLYHLEIQDHGSKLFNFLMFYDEYIVNDEKIVNIDGCKYIPHKVFSVHLKEVDTIVHCMNVKEEHSFVANGVAVHNCLAGEIPQYIMEGNIEKAREIAKFYEKMFHGNFYLEIQPMESYEQYIVNKELISMSKELSIPIIATTDAHYLNYEDKVTHDVLLCLQSSSLISDANRWKFPGNSYYVMSKDEITDFFTRSYSYKLIKRRNTKKNATSEFRYEYIHDYDGDKFEYPDKAIADFVSVEKEGSFSYSDLDQVAIANAIAETENVADKCNFNVELGKHYLPKINIPVENVEFQNWRNKLKNKQKDNEDYLKFLCIRGLKNLGLTDEVYRKRLQYELGIINSMEFPDYFLIYEDIARFCKESNIPLGPGRGCFLKNSNVTTQTKSKQIQDIEIGEKVYCHDELLHTVVAKHEYDVDEDIVSFEIGNKKIDGTTKDHKIYAIKKEDFDKGIRNPQWYKAQELSEGDYICEL